MINAEELYDFYSFIISPTTPKIGMARLLQPHSIGIASGNF